MLQLTQAAANQIGEARQAQGIPDGFGLRVFGEPRPGGEMAVNLGFAEVPAEDDQVGEYADTRLFVAPDVADPLDSKVLDVEETPSGAALVLRDQPADPQT